MSNVRGEAEIQQWLDSHSIPSEWKNCGLDEPEVEMKRGRVDEIRMHEADTHYAI